MNEEFIKKELEKAIKKNQLRADFREMVDGNPKFVFYQNNCGYYFSKINIGQFYYYIIHFRGWFTTKKIRLRLKITAHANHDLFDITDKIYTYLLVKYLMKSQKIKIRDNKIVFSKKKKTIRNLKPKEAEHEIVL